MNQTGGDSFWTHFWASITGAFSVIGLSTEQWIYVFCAIVGLFLSINSYLNNKKALQAKTIQEEARTEILRSYLEGRKNNSPIKTEEVAAEVNSVMQKVSE